MAFDFALPRFIKGELLDDYLAKGWFRIGSILFTLDSTTINGSQEYPVYWLRYNVNTVRLDRKNAKLISANCDFTTHCHPLELSHETVSLFKKYRKGIAFKINPTLDSILGETISKTFDTRIIEVRNKGHLIAAGIFDIGNVSVENIINFYDHAYHKQSLGKFLMISIYQYCLKHSFEYYYPGYFLPGQQVMSYKLFIDKNATEVYIPEQNTWISYYEFKSRFLTC